MNSIEVVGIKIDEYKVQVPTGLSELLSGTWAKPGKNMDRLNGYEREVIKRDGQLVTRLVKRD